MSSAQAVSSAQPLRRAAMSLSRASVRVLLVIREARSPMVFSSCRKNSSSAPVDRGRVVRLHLGPHDGSDVEHHVQRAVTGAVPAGAFAERVAELLPARGAADCWVDQLVDPVRGVASDFRWVAPGGCCRARCHSHRQARNPAILTEVDVEVGPERGRCWQRMPAVADHPAGAALQAAQQPFHAGDVAAGDRLDRRHVWPPSGFVADRGEHRERLVPARLARLAERNSHSSMATDAGQSLGA